MLGIKLLLLIQLLTIAYAESEAGSNGDWLPGNFEGTRNRNFRQILQPYNRVPRPIARPGLVQRLPTASRPDVSTGTQFLNLPTLTSPLRRPGFSLRPNLPLIPNIPSLSFTLPNSVPIVNKPTTTILGNAIPEYSAAKDEVVGISSSNPMLNVASNFQTPATAPNSGDQILIILPDTPSTSESTAAVISTEPSQIVDTIVQTEQSHPTSTEMPSTPEPLPAPEEASFNLLLPLDSETNMEPDRPTTTNPSTTFRYTLPPRYPNRPDWTQSSTTSNPNEINAVLTEPSTTASLSVETAVSTPIPEREIIVRPRPTLVTPTNTAVISPVIPKLPKPVIATTKPPKTYPVLTTITSLSEPFDYSCKPGINAFYSLVDDCDSYIECKKNIAIKQTCPDGLHFNPKIAWPEFPCAYPSEVQCRSNAYKQSPHPTNECPRQYGYFAINDGVCDSYMICQEGKATIMKCPAGLAYNPETTSCDWPVNVPSCNPIVFNGFECPAPPLDEDGQPSDIIYSYRYQSSCKEYVACQLRRPRLLSCDQGLSFDEDSGSCIDSDLVRGCGVL